MGGTVSTPRIIADEVAPSKSQPKVRTRDDLIKDAVVSGNQVILQKDVYDNIKEVSKAIDVFAKDDVISLMEIADNINKELASKGKTDLQISKAVSSSLESFHKAIISQIQDSEEFKDFDTLPVEVKKAKLETIMNPSDPSKKMTNVFQLLNGFYKSELDPVINKIVQDTSHDKKFVEDVNLIGKRITEMKVRYKFFEFKYIELNLFMILLMQHIYSAMDKFVDNVIEFNTLRDANRQAIMKDTVNAMVQILNTANLDLNAKDFEHLTKLMDDVRSDISKKTIELEDKKKMLMTTTSEELKTLIESLTPSLKENIKNILINPQSQQGGKKKDYKANGGFVRDHSKFPQAFYDIDGVAPAPSGCAS